MDEQEATFTSRESNRKGEQAMMKIRIDPDYGWSVVYETAPKFDLEKWLRSLAEQKYSSE